MESKEIEMTVKDFLKFCCNSNVVLKDSFNAKIYRNPKKHLDMVVHGFYVDAEVSGHASYNVGVRPQVVAWVRHDFSEEEWYEKQE